jgi:hypothetical protein
MGLGVHWRALRAHLPGLCQLHQWVGEQHGVQEPRKSPGWGQEMPRYGLLRSSVASVLCAEAQEPHQLLMLAGTSAQSPSVIWGRTHLHGPFPALC